jgi:hypothetical protein
MYFLGPDGASPGDEFPPFTEIRIVTALPDSVNGTVNNVDFAIEVVDERGTWRPLEGTGETIEQRRWRHGAEVLSKKYGSWRAFPTEPTPRSHDRWDRSLTVYAYSGSSPAILRVRSRRSVVAVLSRERTADWCYETIVRPAGAAPDSLTAIDPTWSPHGLFLPFADMEKGLVATTLACSVDAATCESQRAIFGLPHTTCIPGLGNSSTEQWMYVSPAGLADGPMSWADCQRQVLGYQTAAAGQSTAVWCEPARTE